MRLEDLRTAEAGDDLELSVRLRWIGGETRLWVRGPAVVAGPGDDLNPWVPLALVLAMRRAEPLLVDGPVSERLLHALPEAQEMLSAWNPWLTRIVVRATALADLGSPAPGRAAAFSRGVDSMYVAAVPRPRAETLTHLVFGDDLEPRYGAATRHAHVDLAREAARRLGRELVVVSSNAREVCAGVVDWEDAFGPALVALFGAASGACGHALIPSATDYLVQPGHGSHALLDPLWSTERLAVAHSSLSRGRAEKVAWLAEHRPDLVELLHVCFREDAPVNCGRCRKCLHTMAALHAAGALGRARLFPPAIDRRAMREIDLPGLVNRQFWNSSLQALGPKDRRLRRAMTRTLRRGDLARAVGDSSPGHASRTAAALVHGRPYSTARAGAASAEVGPAGDDWPPPRGHPPGRLGLVRAIDHHAECHRYAAGRLPDGRRTGELGAVLAERPSGGVPLRLTAEGLPVVDGLPIGRSGRVAWAAAPLRAGRLGDAARRSVAAVRAARGRSGRGAPGAAAAPAGWLHAEPAPDRLPLLAARHPVLPDVLLTTSAAEAAALGYGPPLLLGHLEAIAPVTGALGPAATPVPWTRG